MILLRDEKLQQLINRYIEVSNTVTKRAEAIIRQAIDEDLTNDQHCTLRFIYQEGKCTSTELAEKCHVNKSAITAIINRLYEKGLIERNRDENDRRVIYLSLTDKGKNLFLNVEEKIHKFVGSFIKKFDDQEIEAFITTYEKLSNILTSNTLDKWERASYERNN